MTDIKISVFTPTYNRAHTLPNVYQSLKNQSFKEFEWIIIDDGSIDNTERVVKEFCDEGIILITYHKQNNQGKHIAQNKAVDIAKGELFLPLDSDDTITDDALQCLWETWESIPQTEKSQFSGVACHCMDQYGNRIGSEWPTNPLISNDLEVHFKYHVKGEKWGPIRLDIMKKFKNAKVSGHFLDESTVWFRIAREYKKIYIDKCLRVYEIGLDSVQKRTYQSEIKNAESKLYANLIYINEFYDWYIKYDFKGLVKRSLKVVYYASLQKKKILFNNGVIRNVKPLLCKMIVFFAAPYSLISRIRSKKYKEHS